MLTVDDAPLGIDETVTKPLGLIARAAFTVPEVILSSHRNKLVKFVIWKVNPSGVAVTIPGDGVRGAPASTVID